MNRIYSGRRLEPTRGTVSDIEVFVLDAQGKRPLRLEPSLKVVNHSPTGFNWGYCGSGPAQLALAILLDYTGDPEAALASYQGFKFQFVGGWKDNWSISSVEIEEFFEKGGREYA